MRFLISTIRRGGPEKNQGVRERQSARVPGAGVLALCVPQRAPRLTGPWGAGRDRSRRGEPPRNPQFIMALARSQGKRGRGRQAAAGLRTLGPKA